MILLDTNILIEVLKNNQGTINKVKAFTPPLNISSITAEASPEDPGRIWVD